MGSGKSTPPSAPGLSQEERDLLQSQNISIGQFNKMLTQEGLNQDSNQNLLRQLSGLYSSEDVAARPGDIQRTRGSDLDALAAYGSDRYPYPVTLKDAAEWRSKNGGFNRRGTEVANDLRSVFDENMTVKDVLAKIQGSPDAALRAGFAQRGPEIAASKKYTLNQTAVDDLRARVAAEQAQQQELSNIQTDIYKQGLLGLQEQLPQITALNKAELERRQAALNGTLPLSSGLLDRKAQDFTLLKESAARRGIKIDGDDPTGATSQSSAGNELVGQFNRTYGLLADQERQGILGTSSTPGQVQGGPGASTYGQSLQFAMAPGAGSLLPQYGQLSQLYGGAAQPFQQQRFNEYQGLLNQYGQQQANKRGGLQAAGQGATIGASFGGGPGALIGGLLGYGASQF